MTKMKLIIKDLKKNFDKKEVLKSIDFTFETGKIYGLLGKNGAGKTTLFNCLNEDMKIDGGSFSLDDGTSIRKVVPDDIGYVLSTPVVPEFLTGYEFLDFFININKEKLKNPKTIDEYFDFMHIDENDRYKLIKEYSHGMKNKIQLLVNIIASPEILLLDEPLTSFDVLVAEEMKELLIQIKGEHIIIFSTHIMDLAVDLCDEIVILNNGVLEQIDKNNLNEAGLKNKVIEILKGELNA
ncbi:MAG: ABC transporter ATP-binding protein [Oscillospiraceae bacterium]